jgi:hypothetical protein
VYNVFVVWEGMERDHTILDIFSSIFTSSKNMYGLNDNLLQVLGQSWTFALLSLVLWIHSWKNPLLAYPLRNEILMMFYYLHPSRKVAHLLSPCMCGWPLFNFLFSLVLRNYGKWWCKELEMNLIIESQTFEDFT